jgi:radical SAM superfamily enzyme YgiQ (UPF0313 family)
VASRTGRAPRVLLLVAPGEHTLFNRMNLPPLGVGVVTAHLRANGVEVEVHDLNSRFSRMWRRGEFTRADLKPFYEARTVIEYVDGHRDDVLDDFAARLLRGIDVASHDIVGISAGGDFSWLEMHSGAVLGAHVKRHYGRPVLVGGNNLDYLMQFKDAFHDLWVACLRQFDYMITGPGEDVFLDLVRALHNGRTALPMARPGVASLRAGLPVRAPDAVHRILPPDFDGLDLADYHNFVRHRPDAGPAVRAADEALNRAQIFGWPPYVTWAANEANAAADGRGVRGRLVMPYVFNYNCPYNCAFCTESLERLKVVHAPAGTVVEHMAGLCEKYDTPYLYLFNNYFNLLNGFVEEFASRVVLGGVEFNWSDCARFNGLNHERLTLLAEAGCRRLTFGLETASTKLLDVIDKKVKLAEAERVLRWCKEVGIWADLEIITGLPHEDENAFAETEDFLGRNAQYINYFNVNRYFVAPKSLMGADPERYGMRLRKDPGAYQRLLDGNYRWLTDESRQTPQVQNFRVYEFDEIDGRTSEQIAEHTQEKLVRLYALQNTDFADTFKLMNVLAHRRTPAHPGNQSLSLAPAGGV